ncbi:DUF971 domain-containing protein [Estrella lausannensis]|uniref:Gamma-butyrobetaine hydroxylase-like N-terminal domain-containing protein n=1 Tax=Estrella lausannensis TaxID=483423 RepID=A0A0H5DT81_9BACT|nr:DUF971 domain-containing protein [Estrella lausannensis]CRX39034.1 Conserved hypothetical protein [Estrella lausannensis]
MSKSLFLKKIWQLDNFSFGIEWSDGKSMAYKLDDLQRTCPCALCMEGRSKGGASLPGEVSATGIESVGRYAIKIRFTRGCSLGIYDFDLLYSLGKEIS